MPSWVPTGNLNWAREGHTATLLPNGTVNACRGFAPARASSIPARTAGGQRQRYCPTAKCSLWMGGRLSAPDPRTMAAPRYTIRLRGVGHLRAVSSMGDLLAQRPY